MAVFDVTEIVNKLAVKAHVVDVSAPPCVGCKHWNPQVIFRQTDTGQVRDGIRLCHAEIQYYNFSCFNAYVDEDDIPF